MLNINLEDIDIRNISTWPLVLKIVVIIATSAFVIFSINWLLISTKVESLDSLKAEEKKLKVFFASKQKLLVNIDEHLEQMRIIEHRLSELVKLLPEANEVPSLVNQISQAGKESGLTFEEMTIQSEKKFKYYVELPIKIKVAGSYHQLGEFVSKVSDLPRIVTFHDLKLEKAGDEKNSKKYVERLDLEIIAKTYRYVNASNVDLDKEDKAKSNKKKT